MKNNQFVERDGIYLLNHSVGRPLASARDFVGKVFFEPWESGEPDVWPSWIEGIERFKAALGQLFNANSNEFCPQTNLSSALTKIIYSLPKQSGKNTILLAEQDFPSMGFVLDRATRSGYELKYIPRDADLRNIDTWAEYLTDDVRCVLVTHVYSNTSCQAPVAEITRLTRERNIISVVDLAQSCGIVPIDFNSWRADFVLGSCVKWLCGGPGAAYLWVSPEQVAQYEPVDVGWFSHQNPFEFDIHHFQYAEGVTRFWGGTPSVLPYVLAANSIETMIDIGLDTIREHNVRLTQKIVDVVSDEILQTPRNPNERGGTLVLNFGDDQQRIADRLTEEKVYFDVRPTGIRLSPHIYNSVEEIDIVLDCLQH